MWEFSFATAEREYDYTTTPLNYFYVGIFHLTNAISNWQNNLLIRIYKDYFGRSNLEWIM